MNDLFASYIRSVSEKFSRPETSEMGYRTDFEILIKGIFESIKVSRIDHDPRASGGNKPDFVILKSDIPILYIEAKDIGTSLDKIEKSEQMARYYGYANLVLTDYLEFRFYRNGVQYCPPIKIGECDGQTRAITAIERNNELLSRTLLEFPQSYKEPIKSGEHLAKIMGGKAQRIRDNLNHFLEAKSDKNEELKRIYAAIRELLVHDLSLEKFADMYAQTLVYGLFVARFYDDTPETFSRQEARDLIPASNPFLQHFFDHIAGPNFDKRLSHIVDELCEVFSHANVKDLVEEYTQEDAIIHFYEDFLREYDPELRKKMGAYYTPLPVVNFIVRSVDKILRDSFSLASGLADTAKLPDGKHRVQILDPAVGTGTFISAAIRVIYKYLREHGQEGRWPAYVHHDLLPRVHGFELMMAPYTIAHLRLGLAFKKTGFWKFHQRLRIYLTNSLEESYAHESVLNLGLASVISEEAKEAAAVKEETPIMVVIGNPPYSVGSSNRSLWIRNLIEAYKYGLKEKKLNLDDDYIKFIRFAEYFIEKNRTGIVAMITNNSFIDGITHRQMRKHLLETFDEIYILDLHGNTKKKEKNPSGGKDENVFAIQQGVSINILVRKNEQKDSDGTVYHADLWGSRGEKYKFLDKQDISTINWKELGPFAPYVFFVPKDLKAYRKWMKGFGLAELFCHYNSGIQTKRDRVVIQFSEKDMERVVADFVTLPENQIRAKYSLPKDGRDWKIKRATDDLKGGYQLEKILYRPFDIRHTAYTGCSRGFVAYPRSETNANVRNKENLLLLFPRYISEQRDFSDVFVSTRITDLHAVSGQTYCAPLYVYKEGGRKELNLDEEIVSRLEKIVGNVSPEDIFDYIYAVLHSTNYRKLYGECLKIEFPRVPYPKSKDQFEFLSARGRELRETHLLESPEVNRFATTYPIAADSNPIDKISYRDDRVFINSAQYFGDIPKSVWDFEVGNYKPAQKWLKDRKGRELINEDLEHYQKIIAAIRETQRIVGEIDDYLRE